jgi:dTMP kinase
VTWPRGRECPRGREVGGCFLGWGQLSAQGMDGVLITFEGGEACGKSTQVTRLEGRLVGLGRKVIAVHEPGFTEIGLSIRHLLLHAKEGQTIRPETELLLFAASRAQLVAEVIRPALEEGTIVISDRFIDSTTVYQGYGRGLDLKFIEALNQFVVRGCRPRRTIFLDLDIENARKRQMRRVRSVGTSDRMEQLPKDFFETVRRGYLDIASREPERFKIVDASPPADEVERMVWAELEDIFR